MIGECALLGAFVQAIVHRIKPARSRPCARRSDTRPTRRRAFLHERITGAVDVEAAFRAAAVKRQVRSNPAKAALQNKLRESLESATPGSRPDASSTAGACMRNDRQRPVYQELSVPCGNMRRYQPKCHATAMLADKQRAGRKSARACDSMQTLARLVPETGLEPALPVKATRPSTWRVYSCVALH